MGSPRPSACSEKGVHTAPAKSPPRVANPTTACCAPFMPPGRGAMRATATTTRTISQAPKAPAPGAGGVDGPRHRVPEQEEAREHQHAAVEDEEHVAQHGVAGHAHVAQEGEEVARRVVLGREYLRIDGLSVRRPGGPGRRLRGPRARDRRSRARRRGKCRHAAPDREDAASSARRSTFRPRAPGRSGQSAGRRLRYRPGRGRAQARTESGAATLLTPQRRRRAR